MALRVVLSAMFAKAQSDTAGQAGIQAGVFIVIVPLDVPFDDLSP